MKVFYINAVCGRGSTGRIVRELADMVRSRGGEARVAFGLGPAIGDAVKIGSAGDYYIHNALSRITDHAGLYSSAGTRRLIREIAEFQPDIVHIHNLHGYYVNYELLLTYLAAAKQRVVLTLHDCWNFTGHCTHFDLAGCGQWETRCEHCSQLRRYPVCLTQGDVAGNFDRKRAAFTALDQMYITTPSAWLGKLAARSFLGKYPIHVIPNGVDTQVFRPTAGAALPEGKPIVLAVANVWEERKGLGDCIALANLLGRDYQVVLVGLTPRQKRGLPGNILGICRTEDAGALAQYYTAADILVNPTYEDTFPTVNLEAQACGTPVITYDSGGAAETLAPGMGRTVPRGDVAALARAVRQGWQAPKEIPRQRLDKNRAWEQYFTLYQAIWEG